MIRSALRLQRIGTYPEPGEVLNLEGIARITVVKSDLRKVISVKIQPDPANNE